jgi:ABC-type polysaccharide/polyol phosphate export permease
MTLVYSLVFGRTFSAYYGDSKLRYVAALFVGLSLMNYFSTSTTQALHTVVTSGLLLNKMRVPSIVFPISSIVSNSFQLACGTLPVLLVIAIAVGHNPLWMLTIVLPLVALLWLSLGVGLALSALYVFYRDIPYLYELTYFALFVATPVFYPLSIIDPRYRPFIEYNPLSLVVEQVRLVAVLGEAPSLTDTALAMAAGLTILGLGLLVFRRASTTFMDYL